MVRHVQCTKDSSCTIPVDVGKGHQKNHNNLYHLDYIVLQYPQPPHQALKEGLITYRCSYCSQVATKYILQSAHSTVSSLCNLLHSNNNNNNNSIASTSVIRTSSIPIDPTLLNQLPSTHSTSSTLPPTSNINYNLPQQQQQQKQQPSQSNSNLIPAKRSLTSTSSLNPINIQSVSKDRVSSSELASGEETLENDNNNKNSKRSKLNITESNAMEVEDEDNESDEELDEDEIAKRRLAKGKGKEIVDVGMRDDDLVKNLEKDTSEVDEAIER